MPKISVNIACYNSEKYIARTIESVLAQTYRDFEIVIIDDGSTDGTGAIVRSFRDGRIRYFYKDNEGLSRTRNRGIEESLGEYIAFIDHDDVWVPEKLEKQIALFEGDPVLALVYSNFYRLFDDGSKVLAHAKEQPAGYAFERFLYNYPVGLLTAMIRKRSFSEIGPAFDERLKIAEDFDVFMRILFRNKAAYIHEPLALYRMHENRATMVFKDRYVDEYEYVVEKLKKLDPSFPGVYSDALRHLRMKMGYLRAKIAMAHDDRALARKCLGPCKWSGARSLLLYLLTFFPTIIWHKAHAIKNKGALL